MITINDDDNAFHDMDDMDEYDNDEGGDNDSDNDDDDNDEDDNEEDDNEDMMLSEKVRSTHRFIVVKSIHSRHSCTMSATRMASSHS
jgi:hypothetical protein